MKPYEKYVPSGVQWIGDIPEGWEIGKIGYFYKIQLGKMLTPNPTTAEDSLSDYLCSVNVDFAGLKLDTVKQMWISPEEKTKYRLVKGDLVVAEGGDAGVCCFWNDELPECYIQNAVHRVRAIQKNQNEFLYYWLYTLKKSGYIDLICNKATIAHFTKEKFANCPIILPNPDLQKMIADYLDTETARIDNIIKAKETLIERLKEKRTALITHAVTKGLDPNAKMKPSGIDWIGDIPERWGLSKIKYICEIKGRIGFKGYNVTDLVSEGEDGALAIGGTNITPEGNLDLSQRTYVSREKYYESPEIMLRGGEIVMTKVGAGLGQVAMIPDKLGKATINPNVMIIRNCKAEQRYIFYFFQAKFNKKIFWLEGNKSGAQPAINQSFLSAQYLLIPTLNEQESVIKYLDSHLEKTDITISKTQLSIEKLKEYRTALISACVTGKLDVRSV